MNSQDVQLLRGLAQEIDLESTCKPLVSGEGQQLQIQAWAELQPMFCCAALGVLLHKEPSCRPTAVHKAQV